MMGVSLDDARRLSFAEFTAIRWHFNERHRIDDDDEVEPPDESYVAERARMLEQRGIARILH